MLAPSAWAQPVAAPAPVPAPASVTDAFPGAAAAYLVLLDGVPAWGANVDAALPPASLTKLMTGLLVSEALRQRGDAYVVVSKRAAAATGARLGLRTGEALHASELLQATVIASANDACLAAAEWHSGTVRSFVRAMNERAAAMGLRDTRFANACGLDAKGHVASVRDLAVLARAAMEEPAIAAAARTEQLRIATRAGRRLSHANTNAMLGRVPGVVGVKTGYTDLAGRCIAVTALRDGHRVDVVMLGAGDRWWDAAAMIERGFDRMRGGPAGRAAAPVPAPAPRGAAPVPSAPAAPPTRAPR